MEIVQYASGTISGYCSKVACISAHYGKLPEALTQEEVEIYLTNLYTRAEKPGKSMFEHLIYGLRAYFKLLNIDKQVQTIHLPPIRRKKKLPVVFSQEEVKNLLRQGGCLRNKTILSLLYSAGLRLSELQHLEVSDIDPERCLIHIRQGKGRKDRYVPLGHVQWQYISVYMRYYHPIKNLFYRDTPWNEIPVREVSDIFHFACQAAGINKKATCHTLRHSYATHLLEMGENIYQISALLGHKDIQTTLIYLHLTQSKQASAFSPIDRLFPNQSST
jgi:site-specific recombinase XerD